jgi:hypothetical protein
MSVAAFWLVYLLPMVPAAMGLLWLARQFNDGPDPIPERYHGLAAIVLAPFWPALLCILLGSVIVGCAKGAWILVSDRCAWWYLAIKITAPLYRLHCWCMGKWLVACALDEIAEGEAEKSEARS